MPQPETTAGYSFLPWLRRGIINQADASSLAAKDPMVVNLSLHAVGEGEAPGLVTQPLKIYGPSDVVGLDQRSVVRTIPLNGVSNFEYNYLCGIEFYEEDLPWRYSPALPANSQLSPWLWVVVLKTDEFIRLAATPTGMNAISINGEAMTLVFPAVADSWAWAHTHLNFIPEGGSLAEILADVQSTLGSNTNLGCSRLLCPRRLEPATAYTAFLIPAYEKGRLAGLGKADADIAAVDNTASSWAGAAATRDFPFYTEWSFTTSDEGDFESLARLIGPLDKTDADRLASANKTLDIREPGWGLSYAGSPGSIPFLSALKPYTQPVYPLLSDSSASTDTQFLDGIKNLLNLNADAVIAGTASGQAPNPFFAGAQLEDDPMVLPPLYGNFYRDSPLTASPAKPARLDATTPAADWYNQLNLNPSMRVAAGQGSVVVQRDQESYMNRAWDQLSQHAETRQLVKRWNYSLELSRSFFTKRLSPLLSQPVTGDGTQQTFLTLALVAPMQQSLRTGNTGFSASLQKKFMPSAYSRSFTKLIRPGAPLTKRLAKNPASGIFFVGTIFLPPKADILYKTITDITDYLASLSAGRGRTHTSVFARVLKDTALRNAGLTGYNAVLTALTGIAPYTQWTTIIIDPAPSSNGTLYGSIQAQLNPSVTVMARLQGLLPTVPLSLDGSNNGIVSTTAPSVPEFTEPMYAPLAGRSTDYILPGLENLPDNRVALLKIDPGFIESYMTGLNHEMAREYLWREFPVALNITSFRQFWDVRDNQQAIGNPEAWKDILPVAGWATTALGTHAPATQAAQDIVILIRADLLKKYPNTEVFLQQAEWTDSSKKSRTPVKDTNSSNLRQPLFAAQIGTDYRFLGFDVNGSDAIGDANQPGWFFVLKQRAGEIQFGLDIDAGTDPSWPVVDSETPAGHCLSANGAKFKSLPGYRGQRSDMVAALLYQQPFQLFIHVSRMLPKN
jgi:hypothetical protein